MGLAFTHDLLGHCLPSKTLAHPIFLLITLYGRILTIYPTLFSPARPTGATSFGFNMGILFVKGMAIFTVRLDGILGLTSLIFPDASAGLASSVAFPNSYIVTLQRVAIMTSLFPRSIFECGTNTS